MYTHVPIATLKRLAGESEQLAKDQELLPREREHHAEQARGYHDAIAADLASSIRTSNAPSSLRAEYWPSYVFRIVVYALGWLAFACMLYAIAWKSR